MTQKKQRLLVITVIAFFVILLDQVVKYAIRTNLAIRETWAPIPAISSWFRIIHWKNTGVAFGLFPGQGWILTVIGLAVIFSFLIFYKPLLEGPVSLSVAIALQIGGAIGNLIDRLNPDLGYVVDFIWVGNFPIFNIADIAVVLGASLIILTLWREDQNDSQFAAESHNPVEEPSGSEPKVP